jgi:hypothetical protein
MVQNSSMKSTNELIETIINISYDNLPIEEEWEKYEINTFSLRRIIEINAFYIEHGERKSFNPKYQEQGNRDEDLTFLFMDLRKEMYQLAPQQGAWFSCNITVYPDGNFDIKFNYDDKPKFSYKPSQDKFVDDLKSFPREEPLIPQWLKEIINS